MKKVISMLFCLIIVFSLFACANNKDNLDLNNEEAASSSDNVVKLTERQQHILKNAGLPTVYEELNDGQIKLITAIEEMLVYLDKKYETSFEYVSYVAGSASAKETLTVRPTGGAYFDTFLVTRENGVCNDNYAPVYYQDSYESLIKSYFKEKISTVGVFSDITDVAPSCNASNLCSSISANNIIYVIEDNSKDIMQIAHSFGDWYSSKSKGVNCSFTIYILSNDNYDNLTISNHKDYQENAIDQIKISLNSDGSVVVKNVI